MKLTNILISILMLPAVLVSCRDEMPEFINDPGAATLEGYYFRLSGIGEPSGTVSRVTYPTYVKSTFDANDKVGIFTLNEAGEAVQSNLPYTVVEGENGAQALTPAVDGENALEGNDYKYLIYYPYSQTMTFTGLQNLIHTVSNTQANMKEDGNGLTEYEKSDFLWDMASVATEADGTPKTDSEGKQFVEVVMDHVMATIIIRIRNGFENENPVLCNTFQRTVTKGINLTAAPELDILRNKIFPADATTSTLTYKVEDKTNISMQPIELGEDDLVQSYSRAYRAAVPPQMIESGQNIVTIGGKTFKYSGENEKSLKLEPGKRYTFFIKDPSRPFIDIDDDDTWVYDVVDPLTGEKVGLLCREYIRYQPDHMNTTNNNFSSPDHVTGVKIKDEFGNETRAINSQVWVYYDLWKFVKNNDHSFENSLQDPNRNPERQNELKDDDDPYLDTGIALRFINDVRYKVNNNGTRENWNELSAIGYTTGEETVVAWPFPHKVSGDSYSGFFLSNHGCAWIQKDDYGESSSNQHDFGMHGGRLYWGVYNIDGVKFNGLRKFDMPEKFVTTDDAKQYGHVNIIRNANGKIIGTEVSYDPYLSSDVNVGILVPKYINDSRNAEEGVITYPLVKIGYNNFWTKKGLRTKYYNDGEKMKLYQVSDYTFEFDHEFTLANGIKIDIHSYNRPNDWYSPSLWENGDKNQDKNYYSEKDFDLPGSYAYPFNEKYHFSIFSLSNRDEYTKLYNFSAIVHNGNRLVPIPDDKRMSCYIPRIIRYYELANYVGYAFAGKFMTNHSISKINTPFTDEELKNAFRDQSLIMNEITYANPGTLLNVYLANVTGFDLRALGIIQPAGNPNNKVSTIGFHNRIYGNEINFWMTGDPTYTPLKEDPYLKRDDAAIMLTLELYQGYSPTSVQNVLGYAKKQGDYFNLFNIAMTGPNSVFRSRLYSAVRPVLKFNHQNGPNPHEKTTEQVISNVKGLMKMMTKSRPAAINETPSKVTDSGNDVTVELTPVIGQ